MFQLHVNNMHRQALAGLLALVAIIMVVGLLASGVGAEAGTPTGRVDGPTIDSVTARLLLDDTLGPNQ